MSSSEHDKGSLVRRWLEPGTPNISSYPISTIHSDLKAIKDRSALADRFKDRKEEEEDKPFLAMRRRIINQFCGSSLLQQWLYPAEKRGKQRTLLVDGNMGRELDPENTDVSYPLAWLARFLDGQIQCLTLSYTAFLNMDEWEGPGEDVLVSLVTQLVVQIALKRDGINLRSFLEDKNGLREARKSLKNITAILHRVLDILPANEVVHIIMDFNSFTGSHAVIGNIWDLTNIEGAIVKLLIADYDLENEEAVYRLRDSEPYFEQISIGLIGGSSKEPKEDEAHKLWKLSCI